MPKLQLALDLFDLPSALAPLQKAAGHIDIIECGTILCLSEGMHAVRAVKSLFPNKIVLADVRIAEAGSIISKMCFDAGADWVSVVSGAAPASAEVVLKEAQARGRDMQIELSDGWTWEMVEHWRELGVGQIITKRSRDGEAAGDLSWQEGDLETIQRLHNMGYKVSVAGGVKAADVPRFAGVPVYAFIVGRAIYGADDVAAAAQGFKMLFRKHSGTRKSMLPLGIYEKALPFDLSWEKRLELAREIGFDFVELSVDESDERIARLESGSKERQSIHRAVQATGVPLKTLCLSAHRKYPLGSASSETQRKSHDLLARAIDLAVELGVRIIQVAGYYVYYEEETADCIRCYEEGLTKGLELAAQAGVMLAIENMDTLGVCSLKEGMRLVDKYDSPWLQLYPDIGNLIERSCDALAELEAAKGHMVALHVKDARPGEPRRVPFGEGEVDFVAAFERLAQLGFNGPILVEMWNDNAPDSLQKVKEARAFVLKRMAEVGLIKKVETVR